jgi:heptosyltransferase III
LNKLSLTGFDTLPRQAAKILVWHQGALGDVLLAGPALQAVAAHYPGARFTCVGGPEQLGLLAPALPVEVVWSSHRALWLDLFQDGGEMDPRLHHVLAGFDLALVFGPAEEPARLERFRRGGVAQVFWVPSFPTRERIAISRLQRDRLEQTGLKEPGPPFRLVRPEAERGKARAWLRKRSRAGAPRVALAPGSGHPKKNWPAAAYRELARGLEERYGAQVWWVLGPAEAGLEPVWEKAHPEPGVRLLKDLDLGRLAAILSEFQVYVGNDSGVTHLAAALGGPAVAAIFGPSDPVVWAPAGDQTTIITSAQPCAPCSQGREILCPEPVCLSSLRPAAVLAAVDRMFS